MACGRLCALASSQRVWLSWLHKHTGRARRPVFVDTGLRGCEHLMWNISLAKGVRSRVFFASLCKLVSLMQWRRWEVLLLLWITHLQHEYRVRSLTHKVGVVVVWGNIWVSCHHCQCWWLLCVGSVGPVPSVSGKDGRAAAISYKGVLPEIPLTVPHKLVFSGKWLLFVVNSSYRKASHKN